MHSFIIQWAHKVDHWASFDSTFQWAGPDYPQAAGW